MRDLCRGHDDTGAPVSTEEKRAAWQRYFHGDRNDGDGRGQTSDSGETTLLEHQQRGKEVRAEMEEKRLTQSRECWRRLHLYPVSAVKAWSVEAAQVWLSEWEHTIPKHGCSCSNQWKTAKTAIPPDFSTARAFAEWGFTMHNYVSKHHAHHPEMPLQECWAMYWGEASQDSSTNSL